MPRPGPTGDINSAPDDFLTAAEVAQRLRVKPLTIVRLCRDRKLPATKPAGTWLISESDLAAHIEASRPKEKGAA